MPIYDASTDSLWQYILLPYTAMVDDSNILMHFGGVDRNSLIQMMKILSNRDLAGVDLKACPMKVFYETRLTNRATTKTEGEQNTNTLGLLFRSVNTVISLDATSSHYKQVSGQ